MAINQAIMPPQSWPIRTHLLYPVIEKWMLTSLKRNRWVHLYHIYTRYVSKTNHNYVLSPDTEFGVSKICMSESTCVVFSKNLDAQVHYRPKDSEPLLGIYT